MEKITSKKEKNLELLIALSLILIGVVMRFFPHQPNFVPISAIALFGGVYLSKRLAMIIPLAAMFISDVFIGYYEATLMAVVYGSFLLCVLLGFWLKKHKKWYTVLAMAATGSLLFFLITNFAVWIFTPWYEKSFAGLIQCYFMALPFFRNALLGDMFYAGVFFGIYELVVIWIKSKFKTTEVKIIN